MNPDYYKHNNVEESWTLCSPTHRVIFKVCGGAVDVINEHGKTWTVSLEHGRRMWNNYIRKGFVPTKHSTALPKKVDDWLKDYMSDITCLPHSQKNYALEA